ncbi:hypothetical protein DOY81_003267 [Sarcophaga bullata]|nr:hypothetical protein DOY81_003267 [Sarcophaga bullata]
MYKILNFVIFMATFCETMDSTTAIKRGPHHPRSEQSKTRKVDQHLTHEETDNNNALDGLEMLQAAIHQDENFKKLDRDNYIQDANDELKHIIAVIDEFLLLADANKDGLLHYPEYVKAVTGSSEEEKQFNNV